MYTVTQWSAQYVYHIVITATALHMDQILSNLDHFFLTILVSECTWHKVAERIIQEHKLYVLQDSFHSYDEKNKLLMCKKSLAIEGVQFFPLIKFDSKFNLQREKTKAFTYWTHFYNIFVNTLQSSLDN